MMAMTPLMVMYPSVVMSPLVDMLSLLTVNGDDAAMKGYETLGGCVRWLCLSWL